MTSNRRNMLRRKRIQDGGRKWTNYVHGLYLKDRNRKIEENKEWDKSMLMLFMM